MCDVLAKRVLISLNSLTALCGLAGVVGGVVMNVQMFAIFQNMPAEVARIVAPGNVTSTIEVVSDILRTSPYILISLGAFIFLVSISGCLGAKWHKMWLLKTYKVILILLLLGLGVIAGLVYMKQDTIRSTLDTIVRGIFNTYSSEPAGEVMDIIQVNFLCCGVNSSRDWEDFQAWQTMVEERANEEETTLGSNSVPDSCCVRKRLGCGWAHSDNEPMSMIYEDGCSEIIWTTLAKNEKWLALAALTLGTLLVICILLSCSVIAFVDAPESSYKK